MLIYLKSHKCQTQRRFRIMSSNADNYVRNSISKGVFHQHKRVLEMQRDYRRQNTGKRTSTYNQYQKTGGKKWQTFKQNSS